MLIKWSFKIRPWYGPCFQKPIYLTLHKGDQSLYNHNNYNKAQTICQSHKKHFAQEDFISVPVLDSTYLLVSQHSRLHSSCLKSKPVVQKCVTLTHWGRVTHICVGKLTIIGSDNGLSPGRRQAIIWTNAGILLIRHLGTNFSEILIGIQTFSFKKMHLKMSSAKWCPFVSASMC